MQHLFDTDLSLQRKLRAARSGASGADFLMRRAAEDLADRLDAVDRHFETGACLFSHSADAAEVLARSEKVSNVVRLERDLALPGTVDLASSAETLPPGLEGLDLAISLYALHEMNDVPGMLIQIRRALKPDGLFLGCLAGAGTLAELREALLIAETEIKGGAAPRVYPFPDVREAGGLLQRAGFALPVADVEEVTVRYDHVIDLMHDLRAMGAASSLAERSRRPISRHVITRAAEIYAERFSDPDGRIRASFSTIWLSGWAPAPTQQKPLRPGSAQVSLKTILEGRK